MNDRMIELANKAGAASIIDGMDGRFYVISPEMEKFAELIVRECAKVASRAENNDKEFRCMHEVITNHFGVE